MSTVEYVEPTSSPPQHQFATHMGALAGHDAQLSVMTPRARITIHHDGRIEHTGTVDEATRAFLDGLERAFPEWLRGRCEHAVARLEAELTELRSTLEALEGRLAERSAQS